jgi:isopenicillin-N N-acyltransferase like protein
VTNGKLYSVVLPNSNPGWKNSSQTVDVIHVWGSAYQMGEAQGLLLGTRGADFINSVWSYLESQVAEVIKVLPPYLADLVANMGLEAALDATELITRSYTDPKVYDELKGLAAAGGIDYHRLVRVHMIAGLTQGACSMVGLWGDALAPGTEALQLRALDWNMDGPFRDYAAIIVYHPNPGDGNQFALVGFPGFVGALSGMSDRKVAISEIGVSYPDPSFGKESRFGMPFIFVLREILQYDQTIDDAISRMATVHRTCDLILGVGDGKLNEVRGFQYSYSQFHVIDDENLIPANSTWHAPIKDAVYFGMDWICPTYNTVLGGQIRKYYGQITPQIARQNISAVEMSGDNHLVWYDLTNGVFWAAFAAPNGADGPREAYWRQYLEVDMSIFSETKP